MPSQVTNGKAFEWVVGTAFATELGCSLSESAASRQAHACWQALAPAQRTKFELDSAKAVKHILGIETALLTSTSVSVELLPDARGQFGDVRDVVVSHLGGEIGVSCKTNHDALKHSRLSGSNDFVKKWGLDEAGCSTTYWDNVKPLFKELSALKKQGVTWESLGATRKAEIYWTVLDAFALELKRLHEANAPKLPQNLLKYLVGDRDFYKIISETNQVRLEAINFKGTLNRPRTALPQHLIQIDNLNGGQYSKTIRFSAGFTVNCRIHSASTIVEPSLKFDVRAFSWPPNLYHVTI